MPRRRPPSSRRFPWKWARSPTPGGRRRSPDVSRTKPASPKGRTRPCEAKSQHPAPGGRSRPARDPSPGAALRRCRRRGVAERLDAALVVDQPVTPRRWVRVRCRRPPPRLRSGRRGSRPRRRRRPIRCRQRPGAAAFCGRHPCDVRCGLGWRLNDGGHREAREAARGGRCRGRTGLGMMPPPGRCLRRQHFGATEETLPLASSPSGNAPSRLPGHKLQRWY